VHAGGDDRSPLAGLSGKYYGCDLIIMFIAVNQSSGKLKWLSSLNIF